MQNPEHEKREMRREYKILGWGSLGRKEPYYKSRHA
jgi:hypothetical protein